MIRVDFIFHAFMFGKSYSFKCISDVIYGYIMHFIQNFLMRCYVFNGTIKSAKDMLPKAKSQNVVGGDN